MRKAKIKKPKPIGYALFVSDLKQEKKKVRLLKSNKQYKPVMEELRLKTLSAFDSGKDNLVYTVVQFSDLEEFKKNRKYDKEIIKLETIIFKKDKLNAMSYINCLEYLFDDSRLLEQVENVVEGCYTKYNETGNYAEILEVGELRELYRCIKNRDWNQYLNLCKKFEIKSNRYSTST